VREVIASVEAAVETEAQQIAWLERLWKERIKRDPRRTRLRRSSPATHAAL